MPTATSPPELTCLVRLHLLPAVLAPGRRAEVACCRCGAVILPGAARTCAYVALPSRFALPFTLCAACGRREREAEGARQQAFLGEGDDAESE